MKNKIELKTKKVLSIGKGSECVLDAEFIFQFITRLVLATDELFS